MKNLTMADWKASWRQKRLVNKVLRSGRLTYGPMTKELEERFAALHGRKHALFTSSGTSALKIALHALKDRHGWKDGDEVIIPAVTFVATMNVVLMNNLKPVLVDVDVTTANIDLGKIEAAITKKTRAIIPVHLLGQPVDMKSLMKLARKHNLLVVEDSCETMFVHKGGIPVGSQGDVACFSSYIAHLMVTGVGGFIATNDKELATTMRSMMFHGRDESYLTIDDNQKTGAARQDMIAKRFHFPRQGYSDRATEMEAALGLGDLDNWEDMITTRQENAAYLMDRLEGLPVDFPVQNVKEHAFMFFPMYVDRDRDKLIYHLEDAGIHTRTMMPLTTQPVVKKLLKHKVSKYPGADYINKHGLLLPCHQYLTKNDLEYIASRIREFYYGW